MFMMRFVSLACILLVFIVETNGKGGRAGGGGFRGSGGFRSSPNVGVRSNMKPNSVPYRPPPNSYRSFSGSRGGVRWSSFGSGMLAYGIMSNLASRGHYHNHYYGNNYRTGSGRESYTGTGSTCVNNEDFNGTVFGTFACPLPGFDPSARYCCGSLDSQTQYCCQFFDDDTRKISVLLAVLALFGLVICILACVFRVARRKNDSYKYEINRTFVSHPPNIINVNRNMGPRPGGPPMNMPPPNQQQPQMNRAPNARPPTAEGFPLLTQPSAAVNSPPYPVNQSTMPQPLIQNENKTEQPPSYTDVFRA